MDAVALQVESDARARASLEAEFGLLAVSDLVAVAPGNSASLALQWVKERRVFSVGVDGAGRFPGFQFDGAGQPWAVIADVLDVFAGALGAWELALWFTGSNGWLGGQRPVDVMVHDPRAVVAAARHLAAEISGAS